MTERVAVDPITTLKGLKVNCAFPIQVNFRVCVDGEGRVVRYSCEEVKNFVIESTIFSPLLLFLSDQNQHRANAGVFLPDPLPITRLNFEPQPL